MSEPASELGFSDEEKATLASVLDEIIPPSPDGRLPGAGALGLAGYIEQALERTPELRPVIARGLSAIRDLASRRSSQSFAALSGPHRLEVLNELASTEPGFLPGLIFHGYSGYYQNGRVVEALGLEPRPPYPQGYEVEPTDFTLLDAVRQRPRLYR